METFNVCYRTDAEALQSTFFTDYPAVQAEKTGPTSAIRNQKSEIRNQEST
jgi:hypothetical protein